ncbi:hypothetical protein CBR_g30536 [Chara braunii]|uniref:DUF659 domain-containing protein n=1 Tax=Chara braunii TaxID=69332 RepID=A0A388LCZ0_CHABU|nr:hypothetical protein CBR_g30536 [Chara braunii]|eukprot:GBG80170.1 hypothetical protein CBR_g30536 [Chara braunii]
MGAAGKRPVGSGVEGVPEARKRQQQSTLDEVYDPDGQAAFRDTFLQWAYDSGIPFAAFKRQSWYRHKKALASMPRGVQPIYPSFKDIGGGGIDDQRGKVAAMLREVRGSFESVGATILSDGRQSRDARPIVNFLAAAKRSALLYATVQRDGSVAETAWIVLRRWKAIFRSFPPKDVLAICTDSASNYTSTAKLLAKDPDPEIRRITWLPCATHVANLMLSDIDTGVPWVTETIVRARALVRFIKSHGADYHLFRVKSRHRTLVHPVETVTRDAEAEACAGDEETSRCASWWVEHYTCFPDLQEIAGCVMHMWTSASPAERNWAEHERIHATKLNKLKFRKVAQLVEIATNLKLLGCSDHSGGYVLPRRHMATLAEARPDEYTHAPIDDRDEEEEPEPEEWGARPQSAVSAHEVSAQVRRFQQQGSRRPERVGEVFGPRAETLHPYDYVPPPPSESAQTSEQESNLKDLQPNVDKSAERLYYAYGAGPDGFQPHCTVIQESDDDSFPASGGGIGGPTGRAARGTNGGATGGPSGGATHGKGGRTLGRAGAALPAQPTAERERESARAACTDNDVDDDDDDEPLVFHRARMASDRAPSATEGLRRSVWLQMLADSSTGARREVSDHLDDITADEHMPSQHTPAPAPPGDREQTDLCMSDFPGLGHGFSDTGLPGRGHRGERVGDDIEYCPTEAGVSELTEELHARLDREEEQRLEVLQREWAGRAAYVAEQQRARDLETGAADPGGVEHRDPTAPHPFAADPAQTEEHGDPTVPEHGDPAVSNVVLGFRAADTLQPDDVRTEEAVAAVRMEGDSDEHGDGGHEPGAEADDGADNAGRLSPSPSAGPGPLSHGPIGGDDMDLQADDPKEVGGSMSLALVLSEPSPVAHDAPSEHVEGGGSADEEEEGGIPPDLHDHARADMEEGEITSGPLDPDALQSALDPRYSGSPASLEREQHRSEFIMGAAWGAHRACTTSLTPPPPTMPHNSPTPVTGRAAGRGHVSTSSSPRLDTQQSFHHPWSIVRRVDERVRGDFAAHQARLREEQRPTPSLATAYRILKQTGYGARKDMLLGSRRAAPALYTSGEDGVPAPHGERHHSRINELETRIAREEARLRESHEELDRERRRMTAACISDVDTEEESIDVVRRRERERERDWSQNRHA